MPTRLTQPRRGVTLVELIACVVVLAALGTGASTIMFSAADGYFDSATTAQLHAEASIALDRIVRELRNIPIEAESTPDIDSLAADAITWNDDYTIELDGTDLELTENGGAAAVLLEDVSDFTLAAYDEDNDALALPLAGAACDDIRRITVSITLEGNGISETLSTKVFVRATMAGGGV
jgi:prepilin-type N-terminal cleavage/methylation domain-containing protein